MTDWLPVDVMWRVALAAIPLALLVAALGKTIPCRPSTRHAMWVGVVLILICTPFLPVLDVPEAPVLRDTARELVARASNFASETTSSIFRDNESDQPARRDTTQHSNSTRNQNARAQGTNDRFAVEPCPLVAELTCPDAFKTTPSARQSGRKPAAFLSKSPRDVSTSCEPPLIGQTFDQAPSFVLNDAVSTESIGRGEEIRSETRSPTSLASFPKFVNPLEMPPLESIDQKSSIVALVDEPSKNVRNAEKESSPEPEEQAIASGLTSLKTWLTPLANLRDAILALPPIPGTVWLGGIALLALIIVLKLGESLRLIKLAQPAPDWVIKEVEASAKDLELRRMPTTLMVDAKVSPMVWCGRQPRLILPTQLWDQLDEEGRAAVLYHELAHLRRRDHWVSWVDLVAGVLYWWHPVVWWIRKKIREEADLSCDAWVTAMMPNGRRAYAQALLDTKKYTSVFAPMGAAPGLSGYSGTMGLGVSTLRAKAFARRIKMVMTEQKNPGLSLRGVLVVTLLVMVGCIVTPIWACPPDKDEKPTKVESVSRVRVIAPTTRPSRETEASESSTFERYMKRGERDEAEASDESESRVYFSESTAPTKVRIITRGSRDCCEDDCCKGCKCDGLVTISGALNARIAGNVHAHVVTKGKLYCTAKP
ncbi:MAG: M56 family metallopeptidase, partial [Planctomycetota bacterium]|nr:M56 family metallopeptidase [Planctomycetota bacterium]